MNFDSCVHSITNIPFKTEHFPSPYKVSFCHLQFSPWKWQRLNCKQFISYSLGHNLQCLHLIINVFGIEIKVHLENTCSPFISFNGLQNSSPTYLHNFDPFLPFDFSSLIICSLSLAYLSSPPCTPRECLHIF